MADDNDGPNSSRRDYLKGLGAVGAAALLSTGAAEAQAGVGGGPASDEMADLRQVLYGGPLGDRADAGVDGRVYWADDGTIARDDGGSWTKPDLQGLGSVGTESIDSKQYLNSYSRPNGQPAFSNVNGFGNRDVGTIALEADDAKTDTYTKWFQWCKDRGLPFSVATPPREVGTSGYCTWSEVAEMAAYGAEIANHTQGGSESGDLPDLSDDGAIEKVVTFREELEERGFKVQRLVTAGDADFADLEELESFAGKLTMGNTNTVGQVKSYYGASPRSRAYCSSGAALDGRWIVDGMNVSEVTNRIEMVANSGATLTLAFHPHTFNDTGALSGSDVRTILNKIESLRDSGDLNVVTPSVSRLMVGDSRDHAMNPEPSFEHSSVLSSDDLPATWEISSSSVVLNTSTARTGSNSVEIPSSESMKQTFNVPERANAVAVEGYARAKTSGGTATIGVQQNRAADWKDYSGVNGRYETDVTDTWTKFKGLIGLHRSYNAAKPEIYHTSGDAVLVDDVYVYPV